MEFDELFKKRRSCRAFMPVPVTEDQIQAIVTAGQWAPSPLNEQPFEFIAVTDPTIKAQIQKAGIEAKQIVVDNNGPEWVKKYPMNFIGESPLILVVVYNPNKGGLGSYFGQPHGALQSTSACIQNMLLKSADLGLDSLWFTFFNPSTLKIVLDIPTELDVAGAVFIGTPAMEAKAPRRRTPKIHRDRFNKEK
jgi:5,6-dimethylbenzimidazole synthase